MARSTASRVTALAAVAMAGQSVMAQSATTTMKPTVGTATIGGVASTYSVQFTPDASIDVGAPIIQNVLDPQAVDAQTVCPGYTASNVMYADTGLNATLTLAGNACNVYGTDIDELVLTVDVQTAHRLSVNISPAHVTAENYTQYFLQDELIDLPAQGVLTTNTQDIDLQFSYSNDPTFSFKVIRKSTGDTIFDTEGTVLVYEDQFVEFVNILPENYNLYGLGEHIHGFRLGNNYTATLWAADVGDQIDTNIYGSHPFYLDTRYYEVDNATGKHTLLTGNASAEADYVSYSHGVYQRNFHGQDQLLQSSNLTWRLIGGNIDLYFFDGPSATEVTKQYLTGAAGLPAMQQYFTFGYHQCRWGFSNWSMVSDVVTNFKNYGIPLETVWTDIDYMFQYRDFENDPVRFGYSEGQQLMDQLHAAGQHYVPIVDSAIYIPNPNNASDNYSTYSTGHEMDVFMKNPDGSEYIGDVWPGYTVFPDWRSTNAVPWWTQSMVGWHKNINWDGIWIDMSEVSSFCIGSCGSGNLSLNPIHPPFSLPGEPGAVIYDYPEGFNVTNATEAASVSAASVSAASATATATAGTSSTAASTSYLRTTPTPGVRNVNYPPYAINNLQGDLATHAMSPNATHADGTQDYEIHNLFGHQILNATYNALLEVFPGKRPFIIGRSNAVGTGKYAGHWGGDNFSKFWSMAFSIPQALTFSLLGIPMFGVDTCGFAGDSDEELCARWMALSSMFTFYRNHNTLSAASQEPYIWESVTEATKNAMGVRYSLLPYMYTLFWYAHTTGSTVMRALQWEFPNDPTLAAVDTQFMLGPSILVTPVLEPNVRTVNGVFPGIKQGTIWYDWYNQTAITAPSTPGANVTIDAPLTHLPLYIKGGSILPQQEALMTTSQCRNSSWSIIAALDVNGAATGNLYLDDGESIDPAETTLVDFTAADSALYASPRGMYKDTNALANVTVLGVRSAPGNVSLNGASVPFNYDASGKILSLRGLQNATAMGAWSGDWVLRW